MFIANIILESAGYWCCGLSKSLTVLTGLNVSIGTSTKTVFQSLIEPFQSPGSSNALRVFFSFYFSEEILSTLDRNKNIKVRDRATLFNLAVGLDGYTVSSGVISKELNGENIIGKPLLVDEYMRIGTIVRKDVALSRYGKAYMEALKKYTGGL